MAIFNGIPESANDSPKQLHSKDLEGRIYHSALYYLARREYAVYELTHKLLKKYSCRVKVDSVVAKLIFENLLSDERFCEAFIRYRVKQGKGPERILNELKQKKVPSDIISSHLYSEEYKWEEIAAEVYQKKFGATSIASYQEKSKRIRFMQYRGFGFEYIESLIN